MLSREERARQFLAFDALSGFYQALKEKEMEYVERAELSEEQMEEIAQTLNKIHKNATVKVTYYYNGRYQIEQGRVRENNFRKQELVVNEVSIPWMDISKIESS